ncbi:SDR family oxidoreductase [Halorussus halobius]|uniref:SDR family oxidoreductase n=1 Tax=Halorussus halobius TaxID=1710537 RepID=UPI001091F30E|nr:SDR family oxidoreductase [Halorussus halobius]
MSQQARPETAGIDRTEPQLKPLDQQVVVITGASSGIGLTTARMAAERGARVVVAARSEDALRDLVAEIEEAGGDATAVVADVSDREDVREIARVAEETYGGFDTWVNVAAQFIYGRLADTPVEDMREQFDTNVWGLLYGSLEAADHLRERGAGHPEGHGGAIINVGSVVSDRAVPLQGSYSASKHAVKGFTDALRMELHEAGAPVSVTLVKPTSIDTPYPEHAKNYMDEAADLPAPAYAPETVARAILDAAETPQRDVMVGGAAPVLSALGRFASGLTDTIMERVFFDQQRRDEPTFRSEENVVDEPVGDRRARGDYEGHVAETSLYTRLAQRRGLAGAALAGLGAAALALLGRSRRSRDEARREEGGRLAEIGREATDDREGSGLRDAVSVVTVPADRR